MLMLEGRVAFVTGASRGIGRSICEKFMEEGALVYAGIRDLQKAEEMKSENQESGGKVLPVYVDVCDKDSIKNCILQIKKESGRLDVLVNNAGLLIAERFEMMRAESLHKIYDTNVFGSIDVTQMSIRLLKKSNSPCIINMSSIMADESDIGQTAYASSKAAVASMTRTWAKEFVSQGIRVNAIAPGNVDTDMFNIIDGKEMDDAISKIGMKRAARPEEIANVALFLASDLSSYVTGEIIKVNGGLII